MALRFETVFLLVLGWVLVVSPQAANSQPLGVVLLHGKQGTPVQMHALRNSLEAAGFLTAAPEMCWSRIRIYDQAYLDCLLDVDAAVVDVKARGANNIVILGMSLGANAALAYGARRSGLSGIIALAPAHAVEFLRRNRRIAEGIQRADAMVAGGHGNNRATFPDVNTDADFQVNTTASIYLSFFGPSSAAMMPENAEHLKAPLLIVSGESDPTQRSIPYVFARAPDNLHNQRIIVAADHKGTPSAAQSAVLKWLERLVEETRR